MDDLLETVLEAYRSSFGRAGAAMCLDDHTRSVYRLAARTSMPLCEAELILPSVLNSYYEERERVLNPADSEHPLSLEDAGKLRQMSILLQVPLICDSRPEGVVVLGHQLAREEFIYDDYDLMKIICRFVVVVINLPSLRERKSYVVLLANYFLKKYSGLYGMRI